MLYQYAFEAITLIALDTRLNIFSENPDPKVLKTINDGQTGLLLLGDTMMSPILWNIHPKLDPNIRKMGKCLDGFGNFANEKINEAKISI